MVKKTKVKFNGSCLKQDKITITHGKLMSIYIVYGINLWNYVESCDPKLESYLFGAAKSIKKC